MMKNEYLIFCDSSEQRERLFNRTIEYLLDKYIPIDHASRVRFCISGPTVYVRFTTDFIDPTTINISANQYRIADDLEAFLDGKPEGLRRFSFQNN